MMRSFRGQFRRVPALLTALVLVLGIMVPVRAAQAAPFTGGNSSGFDLVEALTTLQDYGLVKGDARNDLRLSDPITRAEMVTILVRALGYEQQALFLASATPFPDLKGHWAAGYVMVARNLNLVGGYPDGTFKPDQPVSYAEALALLLRLVKAEPTAGGWPDGVLTQAVMVGIAPPNVPLFEKANAPATRLDVFSSFYLSVTGVPDKATGKPLLATLDAEPPALVLGNLPAETDRDALTISGQVTGARKVTVAGKAVSITSGNSFSATVPLQVGTNKVEIQAVDPAGNVAAQTVTVVRIPPIARLEITGPTQVAAGTTATYTVKAYNAAGTEVVLQGAKASVSGGIGTFDVATGRLQAADQTASGTITISAGSASANINVRVVSPSDQVTAMEFSVASTLVAGRTQTVQVRMIDSEGNLVSADNGRSVTLSQSGISNMVITPTTATTVNGIASFQVLTSEAGAARFSAISPGLPAISQVVDIATSTRVVVYVTDSSISPFEETTVRAKLVDSSGNLTSNSTGEDIDIYLNVSGADGSVSPRSLTIRRGASYSDSAIFTPGLDGGTSRIYGSITSDHNLSVESATVRIETAGSGGGSTGYSAAYGIKVLGPGNTDRDDEGLFIIQVVDRNENPVSDGSFAFRIQVETSNEDDVDEDEDGIPDNVTVRFGSTGLNPAEETVRTENGSALIYVSYDKSGTVTIKPVARGSGRDIPDDDGDEDDALSSSGLRMIEGHAYFQGPATALRLTATSPVSSEPSEEAAVLRAGRSESATLTAEVIDDEDRPIPNLSGITVTLNQSGSYTDISGRSSGTVKDGKVTFTVQPGDDPGSDTYTVSASGLGTSNSIVVAVENDAPDQQPAINSIYGYNSQTGSLTNGYVNPDDDYMRINLAAQSGIGAVRVYRGTSLVWTSPVLDLSLGSGVNVPREKLGSGTYTFYVQVANGVGYSEKSEGVSASLGQWLSGTYFSSATYKADANELIVTGRGFVSGDTNNFDTSKLIIKKGSNSFSLDDSNVTAVTSTTFTISLDSGEAAELESTDVYNGSVELEATAGWYREDDGDLAKEDTSDNIIKPMGHISTAEIDFEAKKLYLTGAGLETGTVDKTRIDVVNGGTTVNLDSNSFSRSGQTFTVTLTSEQVSNIQSLYGTGTVVRGDVGWLTVTNGANAAFDDVPISRRVTISRVTYDASAGKLIVSGSGFSGDVDLSKLQIKDMDNPSGAITLSGTGASAQIVTSSRLEITLADDDEAAYEGSGFSGSNIYLVGDEGWLVDAYDFPSTAIPDQTVPVPDP